MNKWKWMRNCSFHDDFHTSSASSSSSSTLYPILFFSSFFPSPLFNFLFAFYRETSSFPRVCATIILQLMQEDEEERKRVRQILRIQKVMWVKNRERTLENLFLFEWKEEEEKKEECVIRLFSMFDQRCPFSSWWWCVEDIYEGWNKEKERPEWMNGDSSSLQQNLFEKRDSIRVGLFKMNNV